jgi:hypothetical protein
MRFSLVTGDSDHYRRQESEEGRKLSQIHPVPWFFLQRCVNTRAAIGGRAWSRRTATIQATQRLHNTVPVTWASSIVHDFSSGPLFCNFKLFNILLV